MNAEARHQYWPSILVIAWIRDVLYIACERNAPPDMERIVTFEDAFCSVVQCAVSEQEALASERKLPPVIA